MKNLLLKSSFFSVPGGQKFVGTGAGNFAQDSMPWILWYREWLWTFIDAEDPNPAPSLGLKNQTLKFKAAPPPWEAGYLENTSKALPATLSTYILNTKDFFWSREWRGFPPRVLGMDFFPDGFKIYGAKL